MHNPSAPRALGLLMVLPIPLPYTHPPPGQQGVLRRRESEQPDLINKERKVDLI